MTVNADDNTPSNLPKGNPGNEDTFSQACLLLVDIGNTHVAMATWIDGHRSEAEHFACEPFEPITERVEELTKEILSGMPRAVVVSSVCPAVLARLQQCCQDCGIEPVLVVGKNIGLPMMADLPEPEKVGTDRLCSAAGAYAKLQRACVVADFGTALTVDLVSDDNVFLGGTILPGMSLSARALHEHTALLPLVEVGTPAGTLGRETTSAIRNGIFAMMIGALREISERYATELGKWPTLVLTGGDARAVAGACDFVDHVIPDLCLDGLLIAYKNAVTQASREDESR